MIFLGFSYKIIDTQCLDPITTSPGGSTTNVLAPRGDVELIVSIFGIRIRVRGVLGRKFRSSIWKFSLEHIEILLWACQVSLNANNFPSIMSRLQLKSWILTKALCSWGTPHADLQIGLKVLPSSSTNYILKWAPREILKSWILMGGVKILKSWNLENLEILKSWILIKNAPCPDV